ncbi:MAG: A/G-specific adenine glycosylase [Treponema sp.]|jgi:A/G-specific adenine glycosylase|nr:A/G-specific adenine glycosylase [Treponema sp.]
MDIREFQRVIYSHYDEAGRAFPWREETAGPWGVFVSEFMLQQTQTERVIPYWKRWMDRWPRPADLAAASLEMVLREWSGLGYNRRARYLWECAGIIAGKFGGVVPGAPESLLPLPGIGPYTAGAVACFAYNYPAVFIETNIRAAIIHFFFHAGERREPVDDRDLFPILKASLDSRNPRKWYWALMDYGAALKKITANPNRASIHYVKQSPFAGSFRQLRGALVKALVSQGPGSAGELLRRIDGLPGLERDGLYKALKSLEKDFIVAEQGGVYRIGGGGVV